MLAITGKNPLEKCKVEGKAVQKFYDKEMKGSIFVMGQNSKISLPPDNDKNGLCLT